MDKNKEEKTYRTVTEVNKPTAIKLVKIIYDVEDVEEGYKLVKEKFGGGKAEITVNLIHKGFMTSPDFENFKRAILYSDKTIRIECY